MPRYTKNLHQQFYLKLQSMQAFGHSRHEAKINCTARFLIFSFATFHLYFAICKRFSNWLKQEYPSIKTIKQTRPYVKKWITWLEDQGQSPATLATYASALSKIFQFSKNDRDRPILPKRTRAGITRSRRPVKMDDHFSEPKNQKLVDLLRATGTRRNVANRITGDDLWSMDRIVTEMHKLESMPSLTQQEKKHLDAMKTASCTFPTYAWFLHHRRDKGGFSRFAPIIGPNAEKVVDMLQDTGKLERVFKRIPWHCDVHSYRSEYAMELYRIHARPIHEIPYDRISKAGKEYQSDVYHCRRDLAGVHLDKTAMLIVSRALGHNRITIFAQNYYRHN